MGGGDMAQFIQDDVEALEPAALLGRSYHPTRWVLVNRTLDVVDRVSRGRAGWVQRFISYGFIGGFAAVVNLIIFFVMFYLAPLGFNDAIFTQHAAHWLIAFAVASEISIFANFIPNDHFTFRHLPGHQRVWVARAARFQLTCMPGTLFTGAISAAGHFAHIQAGLAQAIAIAIVFLFNFAFHHIFTYRHIAHK
jgi:putative flippase GtrA